jgi:hypothetical protein
MFCSGKTLKYMPEIPNKEKVIARYRLRYRVLAISMVVSPVAAYPFNEFTSQNSLVFWAEAFGIWAFGIYWLVKTKELSLSDVLSFGRNPHGRSGPGSQRHVFSGARVYRRF